MKQLLAFVLILITACSSPKQDYGKAENALDAGREFLDACLKGDFGKAAFYMLPDDTNKQHLQDIEAAYRKNDKEGRQQLRQASINISEVDDVNETTTIINYSNSFDKTGHKIKVIKQADSWLVDLKYTFNPNL